MPSQNPAWNTSAWWFSKDSSPCTLGLLPPQKSILQRQAAAKSAWVPVSTARCYLLIYQDQSSG